MKHIFIHGMGQTASAWAEVIVQLPVDVLCPENSVLLESKETTYDNLYRGFSDYCNSLSQPLSLCGISLGGILALNYAIDHPYKVSSLVLIGAQYKPPKTLMKIQNIIFSLMPKSAFVKMGMLREDILTLTRSMMDLDFSSRLQQITSPTLVICGEKDVAANKNAARGLAASIAGAELKWAAGAGHMVNTEKPKALADMLNTFYDVQRAK
jgi:pimeloyl-ACP methyl ester carboxylesterase